MYSNIVCIFIVLRYWAHPRTRTHDQVISGLSTCVWYTVTNFEKNNPFCIFHPVIFITIQFLSHQKYYLLIPFNESIVELFKASEGES